MPAKAKNVQTTGEARSLRQLLADHERVILLMTLNKCGFSRTKAAKTLGITSIYLWRRMKVLGVDLKIIPRTTPGRPKRTSGGPKVTW